MKERLTFTVCNMSKTDWVRLMLYSKWSIVKADFSYTSVTLLMTLQYYFFPRKVMLKKPIPNIKLVKLLLEGFFRSSLLKPPLLHMAGKKGLKIYCCS